MHHMESVTAELDIHIPEDPEQTMTVLQQELKKLRDGSGEHCCQAHLISMANAAEDVGDKQTVSCWLLQLTPN